MNPKNKPQKLTQRLWFLTRAFGLLFGFVFLLLALVFVVSPVGFRKHVFTPLREISYFANELDIFSSWDQIKRAKISAAKIVRISGDKKKSMEIVADLRVPSKPGQSSAVLLLHGATHLGRKSGLIVLLGYYFQQSGWLVLAPDSRGFGDSDDPDDIASPESWDPVPDIRRCIDYLYSLPSVDKKAIFLSGIPREAVMRSRLLKMMLGSGQWY